MIQIGKYLVKTDVYYDPETHFWVDPSKGTAIIGMSPLVQETSGSFVAVQINKSGSELVQGEAFGTIEAEKHVGPLKAPLSGTIVTINENVVENPRLINDDPYGEGWLMEVSLADEKSLSNLIHGEENIKNWFEEELKKYDEKGWIAQP